MRTSTARTVALTVAPVLLLPACSGGMAYAEEEACHRVHAWYTGGQDPDRFDQTVTAAQDALGEADDSPLADPLVDLVGSTDDERVAAVEAFMTVCAAQGWEPPEG